MKDIPFVFGKVTSGKNFTDREKETKILSLNFRNGVNTILISPRRMGKSSLVEKVANTVASDKLKVVNMDIFSCKSEDDFYDMFSTEIIRQAAGTFEKITSYIGEFLSGIRPVVEFSPDLATGFNMSLSASKREMDVRTVLELPEVIAKKKNLDIVVCIDEFQQIAEFNDPVTFQKQLRTVWQHFERTSFCLYGSRKHMMQKIFGDKGMPFYRFGSVTNLGPIPQEEWQKYITGQFEASGKSISPDTISKICGTVENVSSYVQQLSWIIWARVNNKAEELPFEEAAEVLVDENAALFESLTAPLSGPQMGFLRALRDGINSGFTSYAILEKYQLGTPGNVSKIKSVLIKKELIDSDSTSVWIPDPVFRLWLKRLP